LEVATNRNSEQAVHSEFILIRGDEAAPQSYNRVEWNLRFDVRPRPIARADANAGIQALMHNALYYITLVLSTAPSDVLKAE